MVLRIFKIFSRMSLKTAQRLLVPNFNVFCAIIERVSVASNTMISEKLNASRIALWQGYCIKIALLSLLITLPLNLYSDEIKWEVDLEKSLEKATKEKKDLILDFTAEWCGPCKKMDATTFKNDKLILDMKNFICVRIDFDESPNLIGQYNVVSIPAIIKLNSSGIELSRSIGYLDANAFRVWLNKEPSKDEINKIDIIEKLNKKVENIQEFEQSGLDKKKEMIEHAFEGYLMKENTTVHELAQTQLKHYFKNDPAVFLTYLNDERLGVRIFLGNQMVAINKGFEYDPWDNAEGRMKAMEKITPIIQGK